MHRLPKFILSILILGLGAFPAHAKEITVPVTASIEQASIEVTKEANVDFGNIVVTKAAEVLIDAKAGAATPTVQNGRVAIAGGSSGKINVKSPVPASVSITYSVKGGVNGTGAADILQDDTNTANTLTFTGSDVGKYSSVSNGGTLELLADTVQEVHIGGLIGIGDAQSEGGYKGLITVSVNYQ